MSRRAADTAITAGDVLIDGQTPTPGHVVTPGEAVFYKGRALANTNNPTYTTIMLNKPMGYICSRNGQGGKTIYDILPHELHTLKTIGRLDKNSSGLLLLTTDGNLAHTLTHPSFAKRKVYKIALDHPLISDDQAHIQRGVMLADGISRLELSALNDTDRQNWKVTMSEGRNRQIRRTFDALGYTVVKLHRTHFGNYTLTGLKPGEYRYMTDG